MPDATGLELIAQELRDRDEDSVLATVFFRERAAVLVSPASVPATLEMLRGKGYGFLASVHGVDYFPEEPRLGVHYELIDMSKVDRICVRTRVPVDVHVPGCPPRPEALMHGVLKLRTQIQDHPDEGWRSRYGGRGTEEVVVPPDDQDAAHAVNVSGGGRMGTSA